jgi:hypothetical protein
MTGHRIPVKGWKMKDGKLVRCTKHLDVSTRLRQRSSRRVRVAKGYNRP